ncbi:hypothetical protein [Acidithiobacillus ferrivorans]|uniref:hypothetical protein n=1 Tax=Acidithiobacillus ferrivorans TaxID=160808 RepID=UPI001E470F12|nr:hypothetical protein [Acidithiobacillus ferrivorans]
MQVTDKAYTEHQVFAELDQYAKFYKQLAMSVFQFVPMGTKAICNINTYVYSSMQGTVESIKIILLSGRINDAYALLRKYYDSAVINVYSNLYLKDNFSIEKFIVEKINNWLQSKEKLPDYRVMSQYIRASETLKPINDLLWALRITKISRLENGISPFPRHFQAIFTHYPYFICVFPVFLAFFVGFGRIDPYLATDCCIKQVNRRML